jgi:hypothetical protein
LHLLHEQVPGVDDRLRQAERFVGRGLMKLEDRPALFQDADVEDRVAVFAADRFQLGAGDEIDELNLALDLSL